MRAALRKQHSWVLSVANTLKSYGKDLLKGNLGDMLQPIQPTLALPTLRKEQIGGPASSGVCWFSFPRNLQELGLGFSPKVFSKHFSLIVPEENPQVTQCSRSGSEWALFYLVQACPLPGLVSFCSAQCSHGNLGHSYQIIYSVWTCYCYPGTCQGVPTRFTRNEKQFIFLALVTLQTNVFHRDPYPLMIVGAMY